MIHSRYYSIGIFLYKELDFWTSSSQALGFLAGSSIEDIWLNTCILNSISYMSLNLWQDFLICFLRISGKRSLWILLTIEFCSQMSLFSIRDRINIRHLFYNRPIIQPSNSEFILLRYSDRDMVVFQVSLDLENQDLWVWT